MKKRTVILVSTLLACSMLVSCGNKIAPPSNSSNTSSAISSVVSSEVNPSSTTSVAEIPEFQSHDVFQINSKLIEHVGEDAYFKWHQKELNENGVVVTLFQFLKHYNISDDEFRKLVKEKQIPYDVDAILEMRDHSGLKASDIEEIEKGDKHYIQVPLINYVDQAQFEAWTEQIKWADPPATIYDFLQHFKISEEEFRKLVRTNDLDYDVDYILSNYTTTRKLPPTEQEIQQAPQYDQINKYHIDAVLLNAVDPKIGAEAYRKWVTGDMYPYKTVTVYRFLKKFDISDDAFRKLIKDNHLEYDADYILSNYDPNLAPK